MSRLGFTGYECKDASNLNLDGFTGFTATTVETTIFRSGSASAKVDSGAGNAAGNVRTGASTVTLANGQTKVYFGRICYYFVDYPIDGTEISALATCHVGGGSGNLSIQMNSTGNLRANADGSASSYSSQVVSKNEWHRIEVKWTVTQVTTTNQTITINAIFLDGTDLSLTATNTGSSGINAIAYLSAGWLTAPGANKVCYIDDVAWNDDQGASQNSYPGDEKIVLFLPISDNARDTLWTGGAGGTTSLFDAVNNTPPVGTASETNTTQIEHAGGAGGTTDRYDANMTTYTTAGIASGDTINVMQFFDVDGEDVTTGTKLLNFEVLSNPVMASPGNVTAGNDAGGLGTYPSFWSVHRSGMTYNPSVTVGTSPVMRVRRPETATRVASVCFMGIYVSYTPAAAPAVSTRKFQRVSVLGA